MWKELDGGLLNALIIESMTSPIKIETLFTHSMMIQRTKKDKISPQTDLTDFTYLAVIRYWARLIASGPPLIVTVLFLVPSSEFDIFIVAPDN